MNVGTDINSISASLGVLERYVGMSRSEQLEQLPSEQRLRRRSCRCRRRGALELLVEREPWRATFSDVEVKFGLDFDRPQV